VFTKLNFSYNTEVALITSVTILLKINTKKVFFIIGYQPATKREIPCVTLLTLAVIYYKIAPNQEKADSVEALNTLANTLL